MLQGILVVYLDRPCRKAQNILIAALVWRNSSFNLMACTVVKSDTNL